MTKEFQDKILNALKENSVTPKAQWIFLVKEKMIWISAGIVILLGSLAAATTIAIVSMHDLDIAERLGHTKAGWLILSLPYAWILLLVGFILLAEYNIRHTKQGYKYSLAKITGALIILSLVGGIGLYSVGLGHDVDNVMSRHIPAYEKYGNRRAVQLLNPEYGVLAGKVIAQEDNIWEVIDVTQQVWVVDIGEADIFGRKYIAVGTPIRVVGENIGAISGHKFEAEEIIPLRPPKEFNLHDKRKK